MPRSANSPEQTAPEPKLIEGKYAILAVVILGLAGAVGGWWYRSNLQRRAIALWGRETAEFLQQAPRVELLRLEALTENDDRDANDLLSAGESRLAVAERFDVSRAPGLIHLRHSLINDKSFSWSASLDDCRPSWPYALRFSRDGRSATLLLDFDCRQALLAERNARASIEPMAKGVETFVKAQLEAASDLSESE